MDFIFRYKKYIFIFVLLFLISSIRPVLAFQDFTSSCSYGDCVQLDQAGDTLISCYDRAYDWHYTSESCDYISTGLPVDKTQIYIFYGIMFLGFLILVLIFITIPK